MAVFDWDSTPGIAVRRSRQWHEPCCGRCIGVKMLGIVSLAIAGQVEHGLPQNAVEIARPFGFPITNSMVVTWIVALGLIVFAQLATRRMTQVPGGAQNFLEWLVESLYGLLESIIGRHLVERTFWFFATVFIFILAANWVGLIPGVGTIGWGHQTAARLRRRAAVIPRRQRRPQHDAGDGAGVLRVLDRVGASRKWASGGVVQRALRRRARPPALLKVLMIVVFFAAGCLEVVSILFRPVSLSFRLYGNVFAGENMLETMATIVPGSAGCCRCRSISWSCWWVWCRRWCSCC